MKIKNLIDSEPVVESSVFSVKNRLDVAIELAQNVRSGLAKYDATNASDTVENLATAISNLGNVVEELSKTLMDTNRPVSANLKKIGKKVQNVALEVMGAGMSLRGTVSESLLPHGYIVEGANMDVPLDPDTDVAKELTPEARRVFRNMYDEIFPDSKREMITAYSVWCILNALQRTGDTMELSNSEVAKEIGPASQEEWLKRIKDELFQGVDEESFMTRADGVWRKHVGRPLGIAKREIPE